MIRLYKHQKLRQYARVHGLDFFLANFSRKEGTMNFLDQKIETIKQKLCCTTLEELEEKLKKVGENACKENSAKN